MPYTNDPVNNPVDRIRIWVGDTNPQEDIISDAVYEWLLSTFPTERRVCYEAVKIILAELAKVAVRERVGQEEIYGQEAFDNYKRLLEQLEADMTLGLGSTGIYAGGISREDMRNNRANSDNVPRGVQRGLGTSITGDALATYPINPSK